MPDIASVTGLAVKVDTDGDYSFADETGLTLDTDFWLGPWERLTAALTPESAPARFIELHPDSAIVTIFPAQKRAVEVTASWGWPAVPKAVELAAVHLAAILRLESPRATQRIQEGLDAVIGTSRQAQEIISELQRAYGRPVLV